MNWLRDLPRPDAVGQPATPISVFEQATDAIVMGDLDTLDCLLAENPGLVRERSSREHRATLLHYVSANGVEDYRQKTPANIVAIANRLLDAGAEVDAAAEMYGGGATTLGLTVTSAHPRLAGVQNQLADLLITRGARIGDRIVRDCLANGCPEAAHHLVTRYGATVDLEGAAGVGLVDTVRGIFDLPGGPPSTREAAKALMMASWYGRLDVVELLLDRGLAVDTRDEDEGHTALHLAAYEGKPSLVELLLRRGAPVHLTDRTYGTPPMVWALHAWLTEGREAGGYPAVVRLLVQAGAEVKPEWLEDERLRSAIDE